MMRLFLLVFVCLCSLSLHAQERKKTQRATPHTLTQKAKKAKAISSKNSKSKNKATAKTPTNEGIRKLQNEQASLQKKLKESKTQLASTQKHVKSQLQNLQIINGKIDVQQRMVNDIRKEVDTLSQKINGYEHELRLLEDDLNECKRKYTRGILYMHRNRGTQNKLMFIFAAQNFREMYRRMRYAQEYTKYQRAQGQSIQEKEVAVRAKRDQLSAARSSKTQLLRKGEVEQQQLEDRRKEQQVVVNDLNQKQQQLQATIQQQQQQYNALNNRIEQLIQAEIAAAERRRKAEEARRKAQEEKQRKELERQRKEAERQRKAEERSRASKTERGDKSKTKSTNKPEPTTKPVAPKYVAPDDTDRKLSSSFAANQGRLPVPITGSYVISSHFGTYNVQGLNNVKLDNKGINLTSPGGAQARSIFDGEVTMIFSMGGFSNVIVRHGSYISVYCNLSSVSVRQGQKVSTRQILGNVGRDASGNCTLHFQLRHETNKLNPERWIGR